MNVAAKNWPTKAPPPRVAATGLAPSLERKRLRLYLVQVVVDVIALTGCFFAAGIIYFDGAVPRQPVLAAQLLIPLYLTIALHNASYSLGSLIDWRGATLKMASAMVIAAALLNFLAFFVKLNAYFSRVMFIGGLMLAIGVMSVTRRLMSEWVRRQWGPSPFNVLEINAGGPPLHIPYAYRVDAEEHGLVPVLDDPHLFDRLSRYVRNMDQVIVSCPPSMRVAWAQVLKGSGVHGEVTTDLEPAIGALGLEYRGDIATLRVSAGPLGMRARASKRLFDIAVSGLALLVLSPLLLVCALVIRLQDGGPVFFRQRRLGRGNQFFTIYKLRTMRAERSDADGHRSAGRSDDRVTSFGRFLRRTSLDELPQLLNVLKGDMSIVGPRPHALGSQAGDKLFWQVDPRYWHRHSLRPGITGLAQIRGFRGATDHETDLSDRLQADLEYLAGWNLWGDIRIIFKTFGVMRHERAY